MNRRFSRAVVSIVIVNFNGVSFLSDCLDSIAQNVLIPHEVVIVDNASTDGSAEYVQQNYPEINFVLSPDNLGFAGGNNLGVQHASGDYILLLNNDTILHSDLSKGLELLSKNPEVGILGARMIGRDGKDRRSYGMFPEPWRLLVLSSLYNMNSLTKTGDPYFRVDWVEGSFMFMRRDLWENLGGLDADYFMYVEDVDFCQTALAKGFITVYCPDIVYTHFGGYGSSRIALLFDGFRRYHLKHSSQIKRLIANIVINTGLIARLLILFPSIIIGNKNTKIKFKSCISALFGKI